MPLQSLINGLNKTSLTQREKEILMRANEGLTNKQIAVRLFISTETVKKHLQNAYRKLGACNKIEAIRKAQII